MQNHCNSVGIDWHSLEAPWIWFNWLVIIFKAVAHGFLSCSVHLNENVWLSACWEFLVQPSGESLQRSNTGLCSTIKKVQKNAFYFCPFFDSHPTDRKQNRAKYLRWRCVEHRQDTSVTEWSRPLIIQSINKTTTKITSITLLPTTKIHRCCWHILNVY